jgi:isoleucyl-tRNA synthetase
MSRDYKDSIHLPQTEFSMRGDLPKREPEALKAWYAKDYYQSLMRAGAGRETFVLHDGPPYANGDIHIGHAVNKVLKDIVIRSQWLDGKCAPYVPGWDCHGLPIEVAVEKKLGKRGREMDAEAFRQHCRTYAAEQIERQKQDFKRLGILGDWDSPYSTMNFAFEAQMIRTLASIVKRGHLARGAKPVHWCFDCGSALAEAEIEYADKQSPSIDVGFKAKDPEALARSMGLTQAPAQIDVVIWTTTPWTLPANVAISLHPEFDYVLVRTQEGRYLVLAEGLLESCLKRFGSEDAQVIARAKGAALDRQVCLHPFFERESLLILGDHVTLDAGTGAVHTAPGHGQEDFVVAQQYGLPTLNPVRGDGVFDSELPLFGGQFIWKANAAIITELANRGALLASSQFTHSYPHCWRHKSPVAFRATPQWFISMDQAGLRRDALAAIKNVKWIPSWGEERINGMIEGRPDWCISRQRMWGVPIALFIDKSTQEIHPRSAEFMELIAKRVETQGVEAWYALDPRELLGEEAERYEKVSDILDVWFDSGVTHACVIDTRAELRGSPADLYLEGSDQHRGWFQSSLLTSVAMRAEAPYRQVLTHGFTVDQHGRKMSKSLGNVVAPQKVSDTLGADVLRLWVAGTDYRGEMSISDEILRRSSEAYRKIRNTCRYLLANLDGFFPAAHAIPLGELLPFDLWIVQRAQLLQDQVLKAYRNYEFHVVQQAVVEFCSNDLGALYLDVLKDRMYTLAPDNRARRSGQTAMWHMIEAMTRWLAPILAFTAEELWQHLPSLHGRPEGVLFATWYQGMADSAATASDGLSSGDMELLLQLREALNKKLEPMRAEKQIGASLETEVECYLDAASLAALTPMANELKFLMLVSKLELKPIEQAHAMERLPIEGRQAALLVRKREAQKCIRCWHYVDDIGSHLEHPEICLRCVENVEGKGETRRWF